MTLYSILKNGKLFISKAGLSKFDSIDSVIEVINKELIKSDLYRLSGIPMGLPFFHLKDEFVIVPVDFGDNLDYVAPVEPMDLSDEDLKILEEDSVNDWPEFI